MSFTLTHGSVVLAAITSCTNTSNPQVMITAGLVAKRAVELGLKVPKTVKTSLAPGSKVVAEYLRLTGLQQYLDQLGFQVAGFGCATCIGNSGPLPEEISSAIKKAELVAAAVLSGNRNFEGRVSPSTLANYLASPPLVVAFALAGKVDIDFASEPVGLDRDNNPVFLRDLWPDAREVDELITSTISPELFTSAYKDVFSGDSVWQSMDISGGSSYQWDESSSYIQEPPYFKNLTCIRWKCHPQCQNSGNIWRLGNHGSYFAGRKYCLKFTGRYLFAGTWNCSRGFQFIWFQTRQ